MSAALRFDPVEMPPECEALCAEVREFIAGELAAGLWVPNSEIEVGSRLTRIMMRRFGLVVLYTTRHGTSSNVTIVTYLMGDGDVPVVTAYL